MGQDSTVMGELLVLLTKTIKAASVVQHICQADWWQISSEVYRLWESLDFIPDCMLVITEKWFPQILAT